MHVIHILTRLYIVCQQ